MSTQTTTPDDGHTPWAPADPSAAAEDPRAVRFAQRYAARPIPTEREADTRPVDLSPSTDYDRLWELIVPETRTRANDIHLPVCAAYATRLCDAYPEADRELVLTAIILHDTGWAHVDESRIVSEGFEARCLQHEIDHLNGVLFIDHISRLKRDMVIKKFTKAARAKV